LAAADTAAAEHLCRQASRPRLGKVSLKFNVFKA
jgi:hypothetical protein